MVVLLVLAEMVEIDLLETIWSIHRQNDDQIGHSDPVLYISINEKTNI